MYTSRVNPVCCAFTIMFALFCITCLTRLLYPYGADHDVICTGYPTHITLYYSHSNQKKGWYVMYSMNYTLAYNPEICLQYQNINYKTKKYKYEEDALNKSISLSHEMMINMYPTETREILNLMCFIIFIILFFGMMVLCSNGYYQIERQRLLP